MAVLVFSTTIVSQGQTEKRQSGKVAEKPGLLYKITGKDLKNPSFLFGTIHVICSPDMISMEKLGGYLDRTEQLILEIDMDNAAEMMGMQKGVVLPDGKTVTQFLHAQQYARV